MPNGPKRRSAIGQSRYTSPSGTRKQARPHSPPGPPNPSPSPCSVTNTWRPRGSDVRSSFAPSLGWCSFPPRCSSASWYSQRPESTTQEKLLLASRTTFVTVFSLQMLFLAFFVRAFVGGSIAEEGTKDTLPLLLLTRLTRVEMVLTKMTAWWLSALNLILIGLPVLVASAWFGVWNSRCSSPCSSCSLAPRSWPRWRPWRPPPGDAAGNRPCRGHGMDLRLSSFRRFSRSSRVSTATSGHVIRRSEASVRDPIAVSSPLSLATDHSWYNGAGSLQVQVAHVVALQALFGVIAIVSAANLLRARDINPNWADPTRGYRPPCSDDPIYWREYDFRCERGAVHSSCSGVRYVVILIKAALINLIVLLVTVLTLAVPIGLTVTTVYYGFGAFKELWHGGPFTERMHFNILVRSGHGLACPPPRDDAGVLSGGTDHDRAGQEDLGNFLTTPLSSNGDPRSKTRVVL